MLMTVSFFRLQQQQQHRHIIASIRRITNPATPTVMATIPASIISVIVEEREREREERAYM